MNATTIAPQTQSAAAILPGVFTGMLKNWQATAFGDLYRAGIDRHTAHKICMDYASDLGRLMASEAGKDFKSKIGKLDTNGSRKIAMAGKAKITVSNSMSVVYVAQTLDTLFAEELLADRTLPKLSGILELYVKECTAWATGQNWADEAKAEKK